MAKQDFITQVEGQKMWSYVAYSSVILMSAMIILAIRESMITNEKQAEKDSALGELQDSENNIEKTAMALGLGYDGEDEEHSGCSACS